ELNQCRPDIYPNAYCVFCAAKQTETQLKLKKEDKSFLTKEALGKIVFGSLIKDKRQTCMNIIRGLITQNISESILNKLGLAKK
ncbi:6273_t:CDS:2, partial [Gigaspora rosea]